MKNVDQNKHYSVWVIALATVAIILSILDMVKLKFTHDWWYIGIEAAIQIFFIVDYVLRFVQADGKWLYVRKSMFDLVAIISLHPSLTFFRIPRIARLTHLTSLFEKTEIYRMIMDVKRRFDTFLDTNGLVHVLYINFYSIIFGSVLVYLFEKGITFKTFGDAVWWACVTVTTVGYGDYVPKTVMGRLVAVVLMVVGIGLISMLTGTVATYFTTAKKKGHQKDINELHRLTNDMDEGQLDAVVAYAKQIKEGSIHPSIAQPDQEDTKKPEANASGPVEPVSQTTAP